MNDFIKKPILCLDFDGVIHSYLSGWKGASTIPDPPVPGAMEFICRALGHFTIAIYSSRSGQSGGIGAMLGWLQHHLFMYITSHSAVSTPQARDSVRAITELLQWPTEKPSAMVTIDDRALTFCGVWPSMQELLDFKPWTKAKPRITQLRDCVAMARQPGNFDASDYMLGMANGLTLGLAVMDGVMPDYQTMPKREPAKDVARFKRKHTEIEAVQWRGGDQTHERVKVDGDRMVFMADESHGHQIIEGDWIVSDPTGDGSFYVVQDDIFQKRYEAVPC